MSMGKALVVLTRDPEDRIRREIAELDSRAECQTWAAVEQEKMGRTWVFEALHERAVEVDGEFEA